MVLIRALTFCQRSYNLTSVSYQKNMDNDLNDIDVDFVDEALKEDRIKRERRKHLDVEALGIKLEQTLGCTELQARRLVESNKMYLGKSMSQINRNIEFLTGKRVSVAVIMQNPWLLGCSSGEFILNL